MREHLKLAHISEEEMEQLLLGRVPGRRLACVEDHLRECGECTDQVEALAMVLHFLRRAAGTRLAPVLEFERKACVRGPLPIPTDFLPAERLTDSQVLVQARQLGDCPVLTAMLDTAPGMVALLNLERQIVLCNDACAKAGGLASKEDALGMRPGELLRCIHSTDRPGGCGASESCRYCGLAQALVKGQQGRGNSGECLLQCRSQSGDVAAEYAVQVRPMSQLGAGWQCYSLRDISGEKRRDALERTFFHDIMNRAAVVQGVSSVLAGADMSSQEHAEFVGMLSVSARALVGEIQSHRTLLAAEKGELTVERSDCDSLEALQDAAAACYAFGFAEDKQVSILPGAQSIHFQMDASLLGRILINLLKNALEASRAGMTVTANCHMAGANRIRFSVHNETVMPDQVRAHVFQRSFSTKGSGRGLGTYSIKLLTESYLGGRTWFDSDDSRGTTFHAEFAV
jgi:PAS domain-containing protein